MQDTAVLPGCCTATGPPSGVCKDNTLYLSEKTGNRGSPQELRYQPGVLCSPCQHLQTVSAASLCEPKLSRTAAKVLSGSSWCYGKIYAHHQINLQAHKSECGRIPRRSDHRLTAMQLACKVRIMLCFANPRRTDPLSSTVWHSLGWVSAASAGNPGAPASCKLVSLLPEDCVA